MQQWVHAPAMMASIRSTISGKVLPAVPLVTPTVSSVTMPATPSATHVSLGGPAGATRLASLAVFNWETSMSTMRSSILV